MANTLYLQDRLDYRIEGLSRFATPSRNYQLETTSNITHATVQLVGTTHETISAGDATDTCYAIVENLHASATVQYGYDDTGSFVAIGAVSAGDPPARLGRIDTLANLYLKSSVASTPVSVTLIKIAS